MIGDWLINNIDILKFKLTFFFIYLKYQMTTDDLYDKFQISYKKTKLLITIWQPSNEIAIVLLI